MSVRIGQFLQITTLFIWRLFLYYVFRLRAGDERLVIPDTDADGGRSGCLLVLCRVNGARREDFRRNARSHEAAAAHVI